MAISVELVALDDGGEIESCEFEIAERKGRAAVFPMVQISCCGEIIGRFSIKFARGVNLGCSVCGRDKSFVADGVGCFKVDRP